MIKLIESDFDMNDGGGFLSTCNNRVSYYYKCQKMWNLLYMVSGVYLLDSYVESNKTMIKDGVINMFGII